MWLERALRRRRYLERWRDHMPAICREVRRRLPDARVIVFGSAVRGDWTVDSDIDVLVVSSHAPEDPHQRAAITMAIKDALGDPAAPFEIHYATPQQYAEWYSRFIDDWEEACGDPKPPASRPSPKASNEPRP